MKRVGSPRVARPPHVGVLQGVCGCVRAYVSVCLCVRAYSRAHPALRVTTHSVLYDLVRGLMDNLCSVSLLHGLIASWRPLSPSPRPTSPTVKRHTVLHTRLSHTVRTGTTTLPPHSDRVSFGSQRLRAISPVPSPHSGAPQGLPEADTSPEPHTQSHIISVSHREEDIDAEESRQTRGSCAMCGPGPPKTHT